MCRSAAAGNPRTRDHQRKAAASLEAESPVVGVFRPEPRHPQATLAVRLPSQWAHPVTTAPVRRDLQKEQRRRRCRRCGRCGRRRMPFSVGQQGACHGISRVRCTGRGLSRHLRRDRRRTTPTRRRHSIISERQRLAYSQNPRDLKSNDSDSPSARERSRARSPWHATCSFGGAGPGALPPPALQS